MQKSSYRDRGVHFMRLLFGLRDFVERLLDQGTNPDDDVGRHHVHGTEPGNERAIKQSDS